MRRKMPGFVWFLLKDINLNQMFLSVFKGKKEFMDFTKELPPM